MVKYKPKKFVTSARFITFIVLLLVLNNNSLDYAIVHSVKNINIEKSVEVQVIEEDQASLYKEELYNAKSSFKGELTGYAADCKKCSGVVACQPRTNVLEKGIFFEDEEYGQVRMVASSRKYPCGTILKFKVNKLSLEPIIAVVMDRGVPGNVIDLLTESEKYASKHVGRVKNLEFEILRLGW